MTITPLTHATYDKFTAGPGLVLANFWSTSCGPCLRFRRIYQAAAREIPEAAFGEAEVEMQQLLVKDLAVTTIPTLLIHRDGELIYRDPTPRPESGTFSTIPDAPRSLDVMYRQEEFLNFVRSL
ncbi:thioredoxin family protein [Corynebacterium sp. YIM 101645]|uniref:Thioredoxin family protein n=1 Tax=Corynebacterium lemuris TaxID=1859292 RepID=A0ABT2FZF8_9CORY|nr:thioredoxin family protein [Corynebacterium lemuris]MCS5479422.1 thioredoxin family protein [Corynebacterium lemuris]